MEEEINLVRKKLKWNYKPFEIPKKVLDEWRKIGNRGVLLEKKWQETINKKDPKIKRDLEDNYFNNLKLFQLVLSIS